MARRGRPGVGSRRRSQGSILDLAGTRGCLCACMCVRAGASPYVAQAGHSVSTVGTQRHVSDGGLGGGSAHRLGQERRRQLRGPRVAVGAVTGAARGHCGRSGTHGGPGRSTTTSSRHLQRLAPTMSQAPGPRNARPVALCLATFTYTSDSCPKPVSQTGDMPVVRCSILKRVGTWRG